MSARMAVVCAVLLCGLAAAAAAQTAVGIADVRVEVAGTATAAESVKFPKEMAKTVEVGSEDTLTIRFAVVQKDTTTKLTPHQVFVRFVAAKGEEIIYVALPTNDMYKVSLTPSAESEFFRRMSGQFTVEILVGDVDIEPLRWTLGKVRLQFPEVGEAAKPSLYDPLPTFTHYFRPAEKRASAFMSLTFSALVLAPVLVLLVLWGGLGVNVSNFPPRSAALSAFAFHGLIVALFGVITWYWLQLSIFEFLALGSVIGIAAVFAGSSTLSHIAKERQ